MSNRSILIALMCVCTVALMPCQSARANSLPVATVNGNEIVQSNQGNGVYLVTNISASAPGNTALASGCVTQAPPFAATACATSSASWSLTGGDGAVSLNSVAPPAVLIPGYGYFGIEASGLLSLSWEVEVVGPANTLVPIDFTASTSAGPGGVGSGGFALASFSGYGGGQSTFASCIANTGNCASVLAGTLGAGGETTVNLLTNTPGTAVLQVECIANDTTCTATADPMFQIDPSFTKAGYSLEFSPDLTSNPVPAATPEPGTLSLALLGLIGASFAPLRTRSRA